MSIKSSGSAGRQWMMKRHESVDKNDLHPVIDYPSYYQKDVQTQNIFAPFIPQDQGGNQFSQLNLDNRCVITVVNIHENG